MDAINWITSHPLLMDEYQYARQTQQAWHRIEERGFFRREIKKYVIK